MMDIMDFTKEGAKTQTEVVLAFADAFIRMKPKYDVTLRVYDNFQEAWDGVLKSNVSMDEEMYFSMNPGIKEISATVLGSEIIIVKDNLKKQDRNIGYVASHEIGHINDLEMILGEKEYKHNCFEILRRKVKNASTFTDCIHYLVLQNRANKRAIDAGFSNEHYTEIERQIVNMDSDTCLTSFLDDYAHVISCEFLEGKIDPKKLVDLKYMFWDKTKLFDINGYFKSLVPVVTSREGMKKPEFICENMAKNKPTYQL